LFFKKLLKNYVFILTSFFNRKIFVFNNYINNSTTQKNKTMPDESAVVSQTPQQLIAATPLPIATTATPIFTINHSIDYAKMRNLLLIVIGVSAGVKLLLMLIEFMLDKK
jgi:hypothetical protein